MKTQKMFVFRIKQLFSLVTLLFITVISSAQVIEGTVTDNNGKPLGFANVLLLQIKDSTFIAGTVTREDGTFNMLCPKVEAFACISFLGYESQIVDLKENMGIIVMKEDAKVLKEVTVKGYKLYHLGKEGIVTNVAGTVLSKVGTVNDVLKYIPGLVESEDGFNVFGKGSPVIYINNRQVRNLSELDNIKSEDIKNVELIQNPNTQYAADIRAVVKINTIRPKGQGLGVGLRSVYAQSRNADLTEQVDFVYYNKGIYAFGTYKYNDYHRLQESSVTQVVFADTLWSQQNIIDNNIKQFTHELSAGLNYDISKLHSLGFKYTAIFTPKKTSFTQTATTMKANGVLFDMLDTQSKSVGKYKPSHNLNVYYNGIFGRTTVNLNIDYLFNRNHNRQTNMETSKEQESRNIASISTIQNNFFATKLMLGHQLFGGMFHVGMETVSNTRHNDYVINRTDILSNSFDRLKELQLSPFVEYQHKLPIGNLNVGVRYEHLSFKYYANGIYSPDQSYTYDNIYPSASLISRLGDVMFNLGYSIKTKRPSYAQLSNNTYYINRFTLQTGNPNLKNERIHNFSITGVWKFAQFVINYQGQRDAIIYWSEQLPKNSSIVKVRYKNLNNLKSIQSYIALSPHIGIWTPEFSFGISKQWFSLETMQGVIKMNKPLFAGTVNNHIALPWKVDMNLDMRYQSKGNYQNTLLARHIFVCDLGISKTFFKGALAMKIEGKDLFHLRSAMKMVSNQMELTQENRYDTREFKITLQYNFNAIKNRYKGAGAGNAEKKRL